MESRRERRYHPQLAGGNGGGTRRRGRRHGAEDPELDWICRTGLCHPAPLEFWSSSKRSWRVHPGQSRKRDRCCWFCHYREFCLSFFHHKRLWKGSLSNSDVYLSPVAPASK